MIEQQQAHLRGQLEKRGISDPRVLAALAGTRRDLFVPEESYRFAYEDSALPIGSGQTISQPYIVALMTQELQLQEDHKVLEIGTGSGYQSAILSQLCREVVTVDRLAKLSQSAQTVLAKLEYHNIEFHIGDGTFGCPQRAPYDAVIVTAAAPSLPAPLYEQLKPRGRLIIPVGDAQVQTLILVTKEGPKPQVRSVCGCRFVKLIGKAGWPEV